MSPSRVVPRTAPRGEQKFPQMKVLREVLRNDPIFPSLPSRLIHLQQHLHSEIEVFQSIQKSILCFSFTYDLDLNIHIILAAPRSFLKIDNYFHFFINSATSNIFVPVVDIVDFRRTNADKLELPTISPQRLRRNRLSKLRDDSKQLSPLFTVLSFSYKVKHVSKSFSEQHAEDI